MIVEVWYRCGTGAATRPEPSSLRRTLFWFLLCAARHRFRPKRTEEERRDFFCWRKAGLSLHRGFMQRRNSRAYLQAGSSCGNASVNQMFLFFVSWCFEKVSNNSFFRLIFGVWWWSHGLSGFFFLRISRLWSLCCYGAFFISGLSSKFPAGGSFSSFAVAEFVEETLTVCMCRGFLVFSTWRIVLFIF
jgi:hypothetical protein